ncbi:MAG TPA: SUMF1/EgtB/PvdO family nonheme iron enzyme [Anaerolineaceae bacterium]|nr:SUMF1/EgtB/PvdO family nonheme iron enzyme [Anaerolineaceae bacterium]
MKQLITLLLISLMVLSACEPLQTPPDTIETDIQVFNPTGTSTPEPLPADTSPPPTETALPRPTSTLLPTNPPVPTPESEIVPGELVEIPEGAFMMGCDVENKGDLGCRAAELPFHEVTLPAYLIDRYEVTNSQYRQCVEDGACKAPRSNASSSREDYFSDPAYDLYPVVYINYADAQAYCEWAGMRLPTEAEWEKAARGSQANLYPWGNHDPDCTLANSLNNPNATSCVGDTTMVGSYPLGSSQYGVMDMAGNVWEWVADYFSPNYYADSPTENPTGPESGTERVVRGGGWSGSWRYLRTSSRAYDLPFYSGADLGFRCAMDFIENPGD